MVNIKNVVAILPLVANGAVQAYNPDDAEPGHMSLPNLLTVKDANDLSLNWELYDNIRLDTGRLLIGTGGGGIWSTPGLANSPNEWTIETVVRSSGTTTRDLRFRDQNSISLWLTTGEKNINRAGSFDGFQISLSNKDTKGLKIFSNDGSKFIDGSVSQSLGSCDFNFLDSTIPFTIRVSYSKERGNWFKVQVDNNLCFKTHAISIPESMGDLNFGVSANVASQSEEEYELLKLNVWNHLTEDAIDDHGLMGDGEVIDAHVPPSKIRESLMERTRKAREALHKELNQQQEHQNQGGFQGTSNDQNYADGIKTIDNSLQLLSNQVDAIVSRLDELSKQGGPASSSGSETSYESKLVFAKIEELKSNQNVQHAVVEQVRDDFLAFKTSLSHQFSQMLSAISKLNERVIGEVREHQYGIEELSKKVDLLMANHKEVEYQYKKSLNQESNDEDFVDRLISKIRWLMVPLLIGVMLLTGFIYRLRHDIKHSKLL